MTPLMVCVEVGSRRAFASVLDWPGWCRSGRTEEDAVVALEVYRGRFATVVEAAGMEVPELAVFDVVERLTGSATTDFGAPGAIAVHDRRASTADEASRTAAVVRAAWTAFEAGVASVTDDLAKGPRGGGRSLDALVRHVAEAEVAYGRKLGVRRNPHDIATAAGLAAFHDELESVLARPSDGSPPVAGGWPTRYGARRIAWHVLDHLWEVEDRS